MESIPFGDIFGQSRRIGVSCTSSSHLPDIHCFPHHAKGQDAQGSGLWRRLWPRWEAEGWGGREAKAAGGRRGKRWTSEMKPAPALRCAIWSNVLNFQSFLHSSPPPTSSNATCGGRGWCRRHSCPPAPWQGSMYYLTLCLVLLWDLKIRLSSSLLLRPSIVKTNVMIHKLTEITILFADVAQTGGFCI